MKTHQSNIMVLKNLFALKNLQNHQMGQTIFCFTIFSMALRKESLEFYLINVKRLGLSLGFEFSRQLEDSVQNIICERGCELFKI